MFCEDVVEISSSDNEDNEVQLLVSDDDDDDAKAAEVGSDDEAETSGSHVNDALNQRDASGRVLVNIGHPLDEPDIFLAPQIAAVVKPHQVCSLDLLVAQLVAIFGHIQSLALYLFLQFFVLVMLLSPAN